RKMDRIVALKLIRKELLTDAEVVGRFYREIQILSQLDHPNVVHAYDAGPAGATHFLAMEFVEGTDLGKLVKKGGPLPVQQACEYIRQAALGLQHAHERGLVHRDIKPHNLIMSVRDGLIKVADLGLARLPRTMNTDVTAGLTGGIAGTGTLTPENASLIGTADYLAPEQAVDFHSADIRADIYSLGCTFYYLLTGHPPFAGASLAEKLMKHQTTAPRPITDFRQDVPATVIQVLDQMLTKQPRDRYQTPGNVAEALVLKLPEPPTERPSRPRPWLATAARRLAASSSPRQRRLALCLSAGLMFLVCGGLAVRFGSGTPGGGTKPVKDAVIDPATAVKDAGFETPSVGVGSHDAFRAEPKESPWTFSRGAGVAGNASGFTAGNPNAPQGTQVAFLQGTGSMSQAITLLAGTYQLEFLAAQRKNTQHGSQPFRVLLDDNVIGTFTPASTQYASYATGPFAVTAGPHTLAFQGLNPRGGDNTAFIDVVQVI